MMIDTQPYIDRMLEIENLTADLEDDEAEWLLHWGLDQINVVCDGLVDDAERDEHVHALMAFMRRLNRTVARKDRREPEMLAEELNELGGLYAQAFGQSRPLSPNDCRHTADQVKRLPAMDALQTLVEWFTP